ncbi:HAD family acid phosphatase [Mycoplasma sp. VS1572C]
MNKITKSLMSIAAATTIIAPIATVVACNNNVSSSDKEKIAQLEAQIKQLNAEKATTEAANADAIAKLKNQFNTVSLASSNAWNSISAEKQAMGMQTYASAARLFDKMITQPNVDLTKVNTTGETVTVTATEEGKFIPVVFMDLDETVLNNFAFQNYLVKNNTFFSPALWGNFVNQANAKEVAGAINFIKHVWSKGGVVMFNSNRDQQGQLEPSKKNLTDLGLDAKFMPQWIWWMQGTDNKSNPKDFNQENNNIKVSKEQRMHWINNNKLNINGVQAQFKVVMRVGDDISDFNDNFSKKPNITNAEVIAALKDSSNNYGKLFGNDSLDVKSVYYNPETKSWETENFAASYVLIPGNTSYGSWVKQAIGSSSFNFNKIVDLLDQQGWVFQPTPDTPAQK